MADNCLHLNMFSKEHYFNLVERLESNSNHDINWYDLLTLTSVSVIRDLGIRLEHFKNTGCLKCRCDIEWLEVLDNRINQIFEKI